MAVLRGAEDRSEAAEACRGGSREESLPFGVEGTQSRALAAHQPGDESRLPPRPADAESPAEQARRHAARLLRGGQHHSHRVPPLGVAGQPGSHAQPFQVQGREHLAAAAAAGHGLCGHPPLPAPQPAGHAGHVRLQRPAQDAVPVPAHQQPERGGQRPGRAARGEPQRRGAGQVRPPGAARRLRGPGAALALRGGRALPRRPHAPLRREGRHLEDPRRRQLPPGARGGERRGPIPPVRHPQGLQEPDACREAHRAGRPGRVPAGPEFAQRRHRAVSDQRNAVKRKPGQGRVRVQEQAERLPRFCSDRELAAVRPGGSSPVPGCTWERLPLLATGEDVAEPEQPARSKPGFTSDTDRSQEKRQRSSESDPYLKEVTTGRHSCKTDFPCPKD